MPYNNKNILTDAEGLPIPQHFNKTLDNYESTEGSDGATHVKLTGSNVPDSQPIPVKQLNSKVEVLYYSTTNMLGGTIASFYEMRSTTNRTFTFGHKTLGIVEQSINISNELDADVTISLYDAFQWDGVTHKWGGTHFTVILPAGKRLFIMPELSAYEDEADKIYREVKSLRNPIPNFQMTAKPVTTPTTGQFFVNVTRCY